MRQLLATLVVVLLGHGPWATVAQLGNCWKCKGEGFLKCTQKTCDPKRICGINIEHRCDGLWGASCCAGTHKLLCNKCQSPIATLEVKDEQEARTRWVEGQRKVDQTVGAHFVHVETDHFVLHFSIPKYKLPALILYQSKAAHLFAERLEKAAARFKEVTGTLPTSRQELFLVPDSEQCFKTTLHYLGTGHRMTFKRYSTASRVAAWPDPARELKSDDDFHPHVVHQAVHTLVHGSYGFTMNLRAWIDTGIAHWIEADLFERSRNFCFHEVAVKSQWENANWKKKLYLEVSSGKEQKFAALATKDLDRLDHRDHAHAWSFVDFLITAHPEAFKKVFAEMKRSNDSAKAIDTGLGMSTAGFHDAWREFVLKSYGGVK